MSCHDSIGLISKIDLVADEVVTTISVPFPRIQTSMIDTISGFGFFGNELNFLLNLQGTFKTTILLPSTDYPAYIVRFNLTDFTYVDALECSNSLGEG